MGKKKASRGRKLRALLDKAIQDGEVFVREKSSEFNSSLEGRRSRSYQGKNCRQVYEICIGSDHNLFDDSEDFFVPIFAYIDTDGIVTWQFARPRQHVLDRSNSEWLTQELSEILVMYRLGGFRSNHKATTYGEETTDYVWRSSRSRHKKKKRGLPRAY